MLKIASIVGARPQFIKLAPFCRAVKKSRNFKHIIIHTGQHYDYEMSKIFFRELSLPDPDHHLEAGSDTHGRQTAFMLVRIEKVLEAEKPDWVLVYGDTNSTLAGALAAAKKNIPVAHVEAGLRSFNDSMPEELNRRLTDHCSTLLLCPTDTAVKNLLREGIPRRGYPLPAVVNTGDIMYDAFLRSAAIAKSRSDIMQKLRLCPRDYFLATIHRSENTDSPERLGLMIKALSAVAAKKPVIFPVHPRTAKILKTLPFRQNSRLRYIGPVGYFDMLILEKNAQAILTDSGGVQKEAFFARVPCVTMRDETEWAETVLSGWNVIAGTDTERIVKAALNAKKGKMSADFGDGTASEKILRSIISA